MYNYNINFNDDITFLHGKNGCGKTTILNILTYIITGKIYKLFSFEFEEIVLQYKKERKNEKIVFKKLEEEITINFAEESIKIQPISRSIEEIALRRETRRIRDSNETEEIYFEKYPILRRIKELFNFTYIPLNRSDLTEREKMILFRRRYRYHKEIRELNNEPIYNIADIILDNYAKIKSEISGLGKELQINIVKSMYKYNIQDFINGAMGEAKNMTKQDIDNFKRAGLYDDELGKQIENFYSQLEKGAKIRQKF